MPRFPTSNAVLNLPRMPYFYTSNAVNLPRTRLPSTPNAVAPYLECRSAAFLREQIHYPECRSGLLALQGLGYMTLSVRSIMDCTRGLNCVQSGFEKLPELVWCLRVASCEFANVFNGDGIWAFVAANPCVKMLRERLFGQCPALLPFNHGVTTTKGLDEALSFIFVRPQATFPKHEQRLFE
jgi:hypothetical protein